MKGDFSRDTFDQKKHFLRVLMQQGRVQVDADWNEQVSILLHYMQSLARDIIGPYARTEGAFQVMIPGEKSAENLVNDLADDLNERGFKTSETDKQRLIRSLKEEEGNFIITPGHYYVDGLLCENDDVIVYNKQCGYPFPESIKAIDITKELSQPDNSSLLVYLDVWERHISWCEEASNTIPSIHEAALGSYGPDTATRSRLVWQVKICKLSPDDFHINDGTTLKFDDVKKRLQISERGHLYAIASEGSGDGLCAANPSTKYLGLENQLYRVEIHRPTRSGSDGPTFKWSRDNGSLVFPVIEGKIRFPNDKNGKKMCVTLAHLGLDESKALRKGDWVEFVYEDYVLQNLAKPLLQVENIDLQTMEVTLVMTKGELPDTSSARQPILRRWDQCESMNQEMGPEGDIPISSDWIDLEEGIQIKFEEKQKESDPNYYYRTGDYWLIPARVATKDIEWFDKPGGVSPHGIEHHYAPLAILNKNNDKLNVNTTYHIEITQLPLS